MGVLPLQSAYLFTPCLSGLNAVHEYSSNAVGRHLDSSHLSWIVYDEPKVIVDCAMLLLAELFSDAADYLTQIQSLTYVSLLEQTCIVLHEDI